MVCLVRCAHGCYNIESHGSVDMQPTRELIDQLYREEVLRARNMGGDEKMLEGGRLFDRACRLMAEGIRDQFPDVDDERLQQILRERLDLLRRLETRP